MRQLLVITLCLPDRFHMVWIKNGPWFLLYPNFLPCRYFYMQRLHPVFNVLHRHSSKIL
jgi:hypothetical protein